VDRILYYFFNLDMMSRALPAVLAGLVVTIEMAVLTVALGLAGGLVLAVTRTFQIRALNWILLVFVDVFRAVPALVVIIVMYFALPYAGISLGSFTATILGLSLVLTAFAEEILWAGITAVDRGQWEAARSTGLTFVQALGGVVLPQAIRLALPPLTSRTIAITKNTALGSVVAVPEILSEAGSQQALLANPSPLTLAAVLFLLIFAPLVVLSRWIERRFRWAR
jgi:polar amino acid transport system permease protein